MNDMRLLALVTVITRLYKCTGVYKCKSEWDGKLDTRREGGQD